MTIKKIGYGKLLLIIGLAAGLTAGCAIRKHPTETKTESEVSENRSSPPQASQPAPAVPESSTSNSTSSSLVVPPSGEAAGVSGKGVSADQLGKTQSRAGSTTVHGQTEVIRRETVKFSENVPTIMEDTTKADVNRMSAKDFVALGMPRDQAEEVIKYRDRAGRFQSVDDITQIPNVSQSWLDQNRNRLGVSAPTG